MFVDFFRMMKFVSIWIGYDILKFMVHNLTIEWLSRRELFFNGFYNNEIMAENEKGKHFSALCKFSNSRDIVVPVVNEIWKNSVQIADTHSKSIYKKNIVSQELNETFFKRFNFFGSISGESFPRPFTNAFPMRHSLFEKSILRVKMSKNPHTIRYTWPSICGISHIEVNTTRIISVMIIRRTWTWSTNDRDTLSRQIIRRKRIGVIIM